MSTRLHILTALERFLHRAIVLGVVLALVAMPTAIAQENVGVTEITPSVVVFST